MKKMIMKKRMLGVSIATILMACVWSISTVHAAIKDYGLKEYVYTSKDLPHSETNAWTLVCQLPYNAQFTPWIQVKTDSAGQVIVCDSSNPLARCREAPQRYTTVSGDQSYEAPKWINGEGALYTIPAGVTVVAVKYRETGYDTQVAGSFSCNDNDYSILWQKATRTCYLCMRDSYMDCPDRERAEWLGDAVLEMEECFYAFDVSSHQMAKRFIRNFQVNGLPGQNLIAHGEYGDWTYYLYTGDLETLSLIYPKTKKYLDQYQLGQDGLPEHRNDGWDWYDWGTGHTDTTVIQVAEYYGAMSALKKMAQASGNMDDIPAIDAKLNSVKKNFDRMFWKDDGYRSGKHLDERANAMAVCAGLADPSKWQTIARILEVKDIGNTPMKITIDKAMYGAQGNPSKQIDIKSTIQQLADAGEYSFVISNELAGRDPADGTVKGLELEYRLNGKKMLITLSEREPYNLSGSPSTGGQCGPYFERWALEALCVMGRQEDALLRMARR